MSLKHQDRSTVTYKEVIPPYKFIFQNLFEEISEAQFLRHKFGRESFHFKCKNGFFEGYDFDSLGEILGLGEIEAEDFELRNGDGSVLKAEDYAFAALKHRAKIDSTLLGEVFFANKRVMMVRNSEKYFRPILDIKRQFKKWSGLDVYLTTHMILQKLKLTSTRLFDGDIFILQCDGLCRVRVLEKSGKKNKFSLRKGEVLYVASGASVEACSTSHLPSLQLVISLKGPSPSDVFKTVCDHIIEDCVADVDFRLIPRIRLEQKPAPKDIAHFRKLAKKVAKKMLRASSTDFFGGLIARSHSLEPGQFREAWRRGVTPKKIEPDQVLVRTAIAMKIKKISMFVRVQILTNVLVFPLKAFRALEFINRTDEFLLKDIPGLISDLEKMELLQILSRRSVILVSPLRHEADFKFSKKSERKNGKK